MTYTIAFTTVPHLAYFLSTFASVSPFTATIACQNNTITLQMATDFDNQQLTNMAYACGAISTTVEK